MEKKVKFAVALTIVVIAVGAFLILPPALAEEEPIDTETSGKPSVWRPLIKLRLLMYVLRNGVPTEIEAEAVVLEGRILVVEIDDDLLNVNMPRRWVVDGESLTLQDLFDGDPFGPGDTLTSYSLKLEMSKETHTVTSYFAYEIEAEGNKASAILPFNIET